MSGLVMPGEVLCDLQRGGLRLLQAEGGFRFGTDSVLLADFAAVRKNELVADMGTGSGVIPLLICAREESCSVDAVELHPETAERARRSVALNGLTHRIRIHTADVRDAARVLGFERYPLVVSNPPYVQPGEGLTSPDAGRALARGGEGVCPIEDWTAACAALLKNGGRLCFVFPAEGLLRLCDAMRRSRVEPKRLRFVAAGAEKSPSLLLLEGRKQGRPGLRVLPALITHTPEGGFSEEMMRIYGEPEEIALSRGTLAWYNDSTRLWRKTEQRET